MAHNTPEPREPAAPGGRAIFDLDVSFMGPFSVGIVVLVIVTAFVAFLLLGGFRVAAPPTRGGAPAADSPAAPVATLQSTPQADLRSYRQAKASALEGYHWVDRKNGIVEIPIERAMELLANGAQETPPAAPATAPAAPQTRAGQAP